MIVIISVSVIIGIMFFGGVLKSIKRLKTIEDAYRKNEKPILVREQINQHLFKVHTKENQIYPYGLYLKHILETTERDEAFIDQKNYAETTSTDTIFRFITKQKSISIQVRPKSASKFKFKTELKDTKEKTQYYNLN